MILEKRFRNLKAISTINIWVIPVIMYLVLKFSGTHLKHEWIWFVFIPIQFIFWVLFNWKIAWKKK